jgi:PAS domain S-box-containing protein
LGRSRKALSGLVLTVVIVTLVSTLLSWRLAKLNERDHINRTARMAASTVSADLISDTNAWIFGVVRLAKMWEIGEPAYAEWTVYANLYLEHHPGCIAIEWLEPRYEERWVSRSPNKKLLLVKGTAREKFLKSARQSSQATVSGLLDSPNGSKQWLVAVPIYQKDQFHGFVVGYFDVQHSFDSMFDDVKGLGFSIAIEENGVEGYRLAGSTSENENEWAQSVDVPFPGATWRVKVWSRPEAMSELRSNMPLVTLLFGLVTGLMLIVIAHTADRLRAEVADRKHAQERLRVSQSQFSGILEIAAEAVVSTDAKQRITLYNHAAETIFGYTAGEAIGRSLDMLLPERFRTMHHKHISEFAQSEQRNRLMADRRRVIGLRKDGSEFYMSASVSQLEVAGDKIFTIICSDVTDQVRAEQALRSAHDELEIRVQKRTADLEASNRSLQEEIKVRRRAEEEIEELSRRMMRIQEEERNKLARELHDGATQNLVTLSLHLGRLHNGKANGETVAGTLEKCMGLAEECTNELRTVSYLLHPPLLEELGLSLALSSYVEGFGQRSGIAVSMKTSGDLDSLGFDVNLAVFRIVQEALSNVHRHSQSSTAAVLVARDHNTLTLEITDQGCGMPSGTNHRGVGLDSMGERARLLKGRLEITSGPGGTSITAFLPLPQGRASAGSSVA